MTEKTTFRTVIARSYDIDAETWSEAEATALACFEEDVFKAIGDGELLDVFGVNTEKKV